MTTYADLLRSELTHYQILADQLKTQYGEIDDETLADTLGGISDLPDLIKEVVRSSLEDESFVSALKDRIAAMEVRLERFKKRVDKKRSIACWAMGSAGIGALRAEDFSVSLRHGLQRLEIVDEAKIPSNFLIPVPPRVDRSSLLTCLKRGETIPGAMLAQGEAHISVRVR